MKPRSFFSTWSAETVTAPLPARWTIAEAQEWYSRQAWLVGANYVPSSSINEIEMWQVDTFDPVRIDQEFGWAASLGMNTMRVFLHDLLYQQDAAGFLYRIDHFLDIASRHGIRPMLVLFDSCWDPFPHLGPQRTPQPGVHNSGWMQSPGAAALQNPAEYPRLEAYVKGIVRAFAQDERILLWDVWNEPCNTNDASYGPREPKDKRLLVEALLPQVFAWVRECRPVQPLTSGVWQGDWSSDAKLSAIERIQLFESDVITFHNYEQAAAFETRIHWLQRFDRPILCTEYMARGPRSTFEGSLPVAKHHNVGAYNWGLVAGKSQTHMPWDSWQNPYVNGDPELWFHEIFHTDGRPYQQHEVDLIRRLTGADRFITGHEELMVVEAVAEGHRFSCLYCSVNPRSTPVPVPALPAG